MYVEVRKRNRRLEKIVDRSLDLEPERYLNNSVSGHNRFGIYLRTRGTKELKIKKITTFLNVTGSVTYVTKLYFIRNVNGQSP